MGRPDQQATAMANAYRRTAELEARLRAAEEVMEPARLLLSSSGGMASGIAASTLRRRLIDYDAKYEPLTKAEAGE